MKHYSPSQINTYLDCSARWAFRYIDNLVMPPSSKMGVGTSYHAGLEHNFIVKKETKQDEPLGVVLDATADAFDKVFTDEIFWTDEEKNKGIDNIKGSLKDETIKLTEKYMVTKAPDIFPKDVEKPFEIEFSNKDYILKGRIDLVDVNGVVHENKTTRITPSEISQSYLLQGAIYCAATNATSICFDYAIRKKVPDVKTLQVTITPDEIRHALTIIHLVDSSINTGNFIPNRSSFLCSRKNCGYWNLCEKKYGGKIKE